jgi:SAM-dependent methyltransferase
MRTYRQYLTPGGRYLNLGCALNKETDKGWVNADINSAVVPDVVVPTNSLSPFDDHEFDLVFASHVLEHVPKPDLFRYFVELHRVLKPGGYLVVITPHGASDDAWDNPHHHQCFSEITMAYFFHELYEVEGNAGYGATQGVPLVKWQFIERNLCPYPEFQVETPWWKFWEPSKTFKLQHYRNVIQEVHCVMRAI